MRKLTLPLLALSLAAGACATPKPDRYIALSPQAAAVDYSNTSSAIALPSTSREVPRVIAGYNDHHGVFDDAGRRIAGTSAAAAVFSDNVGDDWTRATFTPPPGLTATRIGDPSLAYGVLNDSTQLVFYGMTAITNSGDQPNRVLIACSGDRGRTFSQWSLVPNQTITSLVPDYQTAHAPSLAFDSRNGKLLLAFVSDQGTPNAVIQQFDGAPPAGVTPAERQANPCRLTWTRQDPILPAPADAPYVLHPMLRTPPGGASFTYLLYEIHRPLSPPSATADTELLLRMMFRPTGSGAWFRALPVSVCCDALSRAYTFRRDTIAVPGQPAARDMAMADLALVEYPNAPGSLDHAVIVWAGAAQPEEETPTIHYEELFFHAEHVFRENRADTPIFHFAPQQGAVFSPTASAWGVAQPPQGGNPAQGGLRAVAWYQQSPDGSLRLMASRSFDSGATFDSPRNLTTLQPAAAAGSTSLCATHGHDFGARISSVFDGDLATFATHHLVFHASSRPVPCTDNTLIDHSVRYQEMAVTRWTVRAPSR